MEDINKAGGVSAVMHEMSKEEMIFFGIISTVTGETLKERIKDSKFLILLLFTL